MKINQNELPQYLQDEISMFLKMEYRISPFIIESIKLKVLPNNKNYTSIPYKLNLNFKYQGKRFKVTVEYYLSHEDITYGLQFYEDEDYGAQASNIATFYEYIKDSRKIIKQLLNSTILPAEIIL